MQRSISFRDKNKLILLVLFSLFFLFTNAEGQNRIKTHIFRPTADSNIINPDLLRRLQEVPIHLPEGGQVKLTSDRNPVQVGEEIVLTATLSRGIEGAVFQFYNEQGVLISSGQNNQCYYRFSNSGAHLLLVNVTTPVLLTHLANTVKLIDTLRIQADSVSLFVEPVVVEQEKPVSFETRFNPERGLVYRFIFGDNLNSDWSPRPTITHIFSSPGIYSAYAEIGRNIDEKFTLITRSVSKQIQVISPPPPPADNLANTYVKLNADRPEAKTGEVITFAAFSNAAQEGLQYMFNFGDNNYQKSYNSSAEHIFTKPGGYTVSVRLILADNYLDAGDSVVVFINPSMREFVTLKTDRLSAGTGENINFLAETNSRRPGLKYIFNFGDRNKPLPSSQNSITHIYDNPGSYAVYVQLVLDGNIQATSELVNISIATPPPVFPWWIYLAGLLVLGSAGYRIKKLILPKISFHPHIDPGNIQIVNDKEFNISCEIHFVPNIDAAKYTISNEPVKEIKK